MSPVVSEDDLTTWWVRGDWNRLAPALRAVAIANVPHSFRLDADAIEDIASQLVIKAYAQTVTPFRPKGWAQTFVCNAARDQYKSSHARVRRADSTLRHRLLTRACLHPVNRDALDEIVVREHRTNISAAVRSVLNCLSPLYRALLIQRDMDDVPVEEIANHLGIGINAVRMRLVRARWAFRRAWSDMKDRDTSELDALYDDVDLVAA